MRTLDADGLLDMLENNHSACSSLVQEVCERKLVLVRLQQLGSWVWSLRRVVAEDAEAALELVARTPASRRQQKRVSDAVRPIGSALAKLSSGLEAAVRSRQASLLELEGLIPALVQLGHRGEEVAGRNARIFAFSTPGASAADDTVSDPGNLERSASPNAPGGAARAASCPGRLALRRHSEPERGDWMDVVARYAAWGDPEGFFFRRAMGLEDDDGEEGDDELDADLV